MENEYKKFSELLKYAESVRVKPSELLKIYKKNSKREYEKEYERGIEINFSSREKESKIIELCELDILDLISSRD